MGAVAWRHGRLLKAGELDNTVPGKVTGWMEFTGLPRVVFDLTGNFHELECEVSDAKGAKILLTGEGAEDPDYPIEGFTLEQTGKIGTISLSQQRPRITWFSDINGRVVLELTSIEVIRPSNDQGTLTWDDLAKRIAEMAPEQRQTSVRFLSDDAELFECGGIQAEAGGLYSLTEE